jgi:hypothetical protein
MPRHDGQRSKTDIGSTDVKSAVMKRLGILAVALLAACSEPSPEPRADWVLHAQVRFYTEDLQAEREPLPAGTYRLWFPYIVGDLYGAPDTGDLIQPVPNADGTLVVDLNVGHERLLAALEPADFSLSFLKLEPADARFARLAPMAMQADGIEQVGATDWIDADSRQRLMLLYADRPCRISGGRYDIRIPAAGYTWVAETADEKRTFTAISQPQRLAIAITPAHAFAFRHD